MSIHSLCFTFTFALALLAAGFCSATRAESPSTAEKAPGAVSAPVSTTNTLARFSRSVGVVFGVGMKNEKFDVDVAEVAEGIRLGLSYTTNAAIQSARARDVVNAMRQQIARRLEQERKWLGETNQARERAFLAENARKSGVVSLPSGLQYRVLEKGEGKVPTTNDAVIVDFEATLLDGKRFESTYTQHAQRRWWLDRHVILPGLEEALHIMPQGSLWELVVPAELAYGADGIPDRLDPFATLIYKLKLQKVIPMRDEEARIRKELLSGAQGVTWNFLSQNAQRPGVVTLPSGLQYEIVAPGSASRPGAEELLEIRYQVAIADGDTVMDSAHARFPILYTREMAAKFLPKGVVEGLSLMTVGSRWKLFMPASLAYGDEGLPGTKIGPGNGIVVEIELTATHQR